AKLMPSGAGDSTTERGPRFIAEELCKYPVRLFIIRIHICLEVFGDHPPTVIVNFCNVTIRAQKQRDVITEKRFVISLVDMSIRSRPVNITIKLIDLLLQRTDS